MGKVFKQLRGYRVYLLTPSVAKSAIQLSAEAKRGLVKSKMKDLMRLKVYAIGDQVTDVKEGDEVLVGDVALMNAPIIDLDEEIGLSVILINSNDIVHIW